MFWMHNSWQEEKLRGPDPERSSLGSEATRAKCSVGYIYEAGDGEAGPGAAADNNIIYQERGRDQELRQDKTTQEVQDGFQLKDKAGERANSRMPTSNGNGNERKTDGSWSNVL
jgi:hypothetical protein